MNDKIIGYHDIEILPVRKGMLVIIPKGTPIHSTRPGRAIVIAGRSLTVRVASVNCGQTLTAFNSPELGLAKGEALHPVNPTVVWVG
jgi:hypothetical protein